MCEGIHSAAQHSRLRALAQGPIQDLGQQGAGELLIAAAEHNHPRTQQQSGLQGRLGLVNATRSAVRSPFSMIMAKLQV